MPTSRLALRLAPPYAQVRSISATGCFTSGLDMETHAKLQDAHSQRTDAAALPSSSGVYHPHEASAGISTRYRPPVGAVAALSGAVAWLMVVRHGL